ncbi:MAG: Bro-N domain-containing protein [Bacteroidales bacterium]|nr:Bro-N domain-containing protein [Bacteroidales bacterium]
MTKQQAVQLFEEKKIRSVWDDEQEKWYFSVADVVEVLTESADVKQYIKKMRMRDPALNSNWGTICTPLRMVAADGKSRQVQAASLEGIFRIIQSIPSPKAEPFKLWMAKVANNRIEQLQDPELSIEQAMHDYKRLGYSDNWINQRLKSIEVRKILTDEWKRCGMEEGMQFASLTDIITKAWSGKTTKEYKKYKGLKKENLRDNMTNTELILNMLAETATTDLSKSHNPQTFEENVTVAQKGGNVARSARMELEKELGKSVVSPLNAKTYLNQLSQTTEEEKE